MSNYNDANNIPTNDSFTTSIPPVTFNLTTISPAEVPKRYHYDSGDVSFLIICTGVCWLMIPGVGFFYSGLARNKSALWLLVPGLWNCAVVSIQWYLIGYSLVFSSTGSKYIGNFDHAFFMNIRDTPSELNVKMPAVGVGIVFCLFAAITPTVIIGSIAERARFLPYIIYVVFWTTLVFDFIMYWEWNPKGWMNTEGGLDYAGGSIVHVSTGFASLAYALMLGKRNENDGERPPHNIGHVILGACLIWFGWILANAVSGMVANVQSVNVMITTNLAASAGGITLGIIDYIKEGKFSPLSFCSGVVAGLVAITPASGYVSPSSSIIMGIMNTIVCSSVVGIKYLIKIDDTLDVFCYHGIGGVFGGILTGVFAQKDYAAMGGTKIAGGLIDGNWKQVQIQTCDLLATGGWSFAITIILLFIINKIPGLKIRADIEDEKVGMDKSEIGFSVYEDIEELKDSNWINRVIVSPVKNESDVPPYKISTINVKSLQDIGVQY